LHIADINNGIRWCGHILRLNKDKYLKILYVNLNKRYPKAVVYEDARRHYEGCHMKGAKELLKEKDGLSFGS
jgi:hypothetical protein